MLSRFDTKLERDGRTNGQNYHRARVSITVLSRDKKHRRVLVYLTIYNDKYRSDTLWLGLLSKCSRNIK